MKRFYLVLLALIALDLKAPSKPDRRPQGCNTCVQSSASWRHGNPSWRVQGYYGVMGGEPSGSYGILNAGAYSYSMGFRRPMN